MRRRRSRLAISLRAMMILVLLVGGVLGWKVRRATSQRHAVAAITRAGGDVTYDYVIAANPGCLDDPQPWAPEWLRWLVGDEWFQEVIEVSLRDYSGRGLAPHDDTLSAVGALDRVEKLDVDIRLASASGLANLARLRRLKALTLAVNGTTDAWLAVVETMPWLDSLTVEYEDGSTTSATLSRIAGFRWLKDFEVGASESIDPEALSALAKLTQLESLAVTSPQNGSDLVHLRALTGLRRLYFSDTAPTDAELANLAGLTCLQELGLNFSRVTDRGLVHVAGLTSLKELSLDTGGPYSDDAMVHLSGMVELTQLVLPNSPLTDAGISHLSGLTKLTILELDSAQATDAGVRNLAGMTLLEELNLGTTAPLSVEAMSCIGGMHKLETLSLLGPGATDEGLACLQGLSHVYDLDLTGSSVTGPGLVHLVRMANLRFVHLANSKITDDGLAHLARLPSLQLLDLSSTAITDAGVAHLATSTGLWRLCLDDTAVSDAGVAILARIPSLQRLELDGTLITDAALAVLQNDPAIQYLSVGRTKVSQQGKVDFWTTRPHVDLVSNRAK
jgi:Leucine-rich repeat (LRR) protein